MKWWRALFRTRAADKRELIHPVPLTREQAVKRPETAVRRARVSRAVVRRATESSWPWDAPSTPGEPDPYDIKAPRLP